MQKHFFWDRVLGLLAHFLIIKHFTFLRINSLHKLNDTYIIKKCQLSEFLIEIIEKKIKNYIILFQFYTFKFNFIKIFCEFYLKKINQIKN